MDESQQKRMAGRETMRFHRRDAFLTIQKRGAHEHFHHLFDPTHPDFGKRFNGFRGGRGGGRTTTLARIFVDWMADGPVRLCAARSFQNSIAESNKAAIEQQIEKLNLGDRFTVTRDYISSDVGGYCIFRGLERNPQSIKSLESYDALWVEEADGLSQRTLDVLEPTIRKKDSRLIFSWNPSEAEAPIEKLAKTFEDRYVLRHTNYSDNYWCPESLKLGAEALKASDYERYTHVYEGAYWSASSSSIFGRKLVQQQFEIDESYGTPYIGVDWGFSQDPTAVTESYIRGRSLYIRRSANKVRLELTDTSEWLVAKVPLIKQYPSFADSARPETISMMAKTIQLMRGAKKWSGSVEDGVTFLQGFDEIVVHPECQADTLSELRSYSYKVDKNDLVTKVILDTNNHYADSMRYGLSPKIVNANDLGFLEFAQSEMIRLGKKE